MDKSYEIRQKLLRVINLYNLLHDQDKKTDELYLLVNEFHEKLQRHVLNLVGNALREDREVYLDI